MDLFFFQVMGIWGSILLTLIGLVWLSIQVYKGLDELVRDYILEWFKKVYKPIPVSRLMHGNKVLHKIGHTFTGRTISRNIGFWIVFFDKEEQ